MTMPSSPPLRTPLALHEAAERLTRAGSKDAILEVLLAYGSQFFDYFAILTIRGKLAVGRADNISMLRGGASHVGEVAIALDNATVFREVARSVKSQVADLNLTDADREAALTLHRLDAQPCIVVPVVVRGRAVLLLYGDRNGHELNLESFSKLLAFASHVGNALETLILRMKLRGHGFTSSIPVPQSIPPLRNSVASAKPFSQPAAPQAASLEPPRPASRRRGGRKISTRERLGLPRTIPPLPQVPEDRRAGRSLPMPAVHNDEETRTTSVRAPQPAMSRQGSLSDKPQVIAPDPDRIRSLVRELSSSTPDEVDATIAMVLAEGEAMIPVLASRFPGVLWFNRHQRHSRMARGRDVSAIARALVAFGSHAVPYVVPLLEDRRDDETRFYAVLVAADIGHPGLIPQLVRLIFDSDSGIRNQALEVLIKFRGRQELYDVLGPVRAAAQSAGEAPARRRTAVRALGELHDVASVRLLVSLLETDEPPLVQAAQRALLILTRQDFGVSTRRWMAWLARHGRKSRTEWLIEALMHDEEGIRSIAFDELCDIVGHGFGYDPSASRKERKVAQRKFRKHVQSGL